MTEPDVLEVWVVYAKGTDGDVNNFVARRWVSVNGEQTPTEETMHSVELSSIRALLEIAGFTPMERSRVDEFNIIEVWL